jgi:hypothetical protein
MRWGKRFGFASVALLCAAGVLASAASAAATADDEGASGAFQLKGTNGYVIAVVAHASPDTNGKGEVVIFVGHEGSSVIYAAPATVTDPNTPTPGDLSGLATSIEADLGELGRISLAFRPSRRERTYRSCSPEGRSESVPAGTYEGTFELHGEEGYTEARVTQTPLDMGPLLNLVCAETGPSESRGRRFHGASLLVGAGDKRERVQLGAIQNRRGARVRLSATVTERRGDLGITREITRTAPSSAFSFDPTLRTAALTPPSPFSGTATFNRAAAPPNRLRGNISIDFPGRSNVPLPKSGRHANLVHAFFGEEGY